MQAAYLEFNNQITKTVKAPAEQGRIIAVAVALAISAQSTLPSAEVEDLDTYYMAQIHPQAMCLISQLGESVVFATRSALDMTQTFWKMRYMAAYPARCNNEDIGWRLESILGTRAMKSIDFNLLYQGGLTLISPELNDFMDRFKKEILVLSNTLAYILKTEANNG